MVLANGCPSLDVQALLAKWEELVAKQDTEWTPLSVKSLYDTRAGALKSELAGRTTTPFLLGTINKRGRHAKATKIPGLGVFTMVGVSAVATAAAAPTPMATVQTTPSSPCCVCNREAGGGVEPTDCGVPSVCPVVTDTQDLGTVWSPQLLSQEALDYANAGSAMLRSRL